MIFEEVLRVLQEYRKAFPHRGIEVVGELHIKVAEDNTREKLTFDEHAVTNERTTGS